MNLFQIKKSNLTIFGWGSLLVTIFSIPYYIILFIASFSNPQLTDKNVLGSIVLIVYTFAYIAIFYYFKVLLNNRYKFAKANTSLSWFIYLNLLLTVGLEVLGYISMDDGIIIAATFLSLIPMGIVNIAIGVKLLSLKDNLFGLKKSLSVNLILSGILYASVFLFLFAIIPSLIITALLGVLFLREAAVSKS